MLEQDKLPIQYSKKRKTYYYTTDVFMKFEVSMIEGEERKKIIGGEEKIFNFNDIYSQTDILCQFAPSPLYQVDEKRRKKSMLAPFFDALLGY